MAWKQFFFNHTEEPPTPNAQPCTERSCNDSVAAATKSQVKGTKEGMLQEAEADQVHQPEIGAEDANPADEEGAHDAHAEEAQGREHALHSGYFFNPLMPRKGAFVPLLIYSF